MESVVLDAPAGIDARLGWDPSVTPHDRKRILAKALIAGRLGVDATAVRIEREAPTTFGHHTRLIASVDGAESALVVTVAEYRAATVVSVSEPGIHVGLDLRDLHPDAHTLAVMRAQSMLWTGATDLDVVRHWTRVQAVLAADGRGPRLPGTSVKLDQGLNRGWVRDRPQHYAIEDLSRNAFIITLAWAAPDAE